MWQKIDYILDKRIRKICPDKTIIAAWICFEATKIGQKYSFQAQNYKNGTLTITLKNHILAQEIQFKENKIILELNKKLKIPAVKKLKYQIMN